MHFILSGACARLIPGVICLSMQRGRIIVAFLYSPFAGALYLLTFGIVFLHLNQRDFVGVFSVIVLFMIIGYLAELMLGIPLLLLFRRFCLSGLLWFLLGGLVIGIAVWLIVLLWLLVGFGKPDNPFASELVFGAYRLWTPRLYYAGDHKHCGILVLGGSADNKALQLTAR